MRQDIILALAVSGFIHGGLFLEGKLFPSHAPLRPPPPPAIVLKPFDLPREDTPPPETTDTREEPTKVEAYLPDIRDRLSPVNPLIDIVQQLQPPPPEGVKIDSNVQVIPNHRPSSPSGPKIWEESMLDQAPVARVQQTPTYPSELRRQGVTGDVLVDFIVDAQGNVQNAHAIRATTREFEDAAVKAVSHWKFKPGRKGLAAVNTHMQVPIQFNLDGR